MEKSDFQALSAELRDCPIGEIEMQLDEMLENFKQGEPNAAKWFVFIDKVKRNCLKLSLSEERQAVIVEWAKYARFYLNKQLSGTLKGTIAEDGSLVLEEPPRVVSETWRRISARAAAPFPSLEALNNESTPTTSSVSTSAKPAAAIAIEGYLSPKCSIDLCDKAAAKVGLHVGKEVPSSAKLKVHALATALKETRSLQIALIGINAFRPVLARRYGVSDYNPKYRPQHGKGTGPSQRIEKWDDAFNSARYFLTNYYEQERRKK